MLLNTIKDRGLEFLRSKPIEQIAIPEMPALSQIIGNLRTQQLNLIVAETGFGKSDFGVDLSLKLALEGNQTLFFSSEMTLQAIFPRFLANSKKIHRKDAEKMHLEYLEGDDETKKAYEITYVEALKDINLRLEFEKDFYDLYQMIVQHKEQYGTKFVFIDHMLSLKNDPQKTGRTFSNDADRLDYFHDELDALGKLYDICFICLTQFNKQGEYGQQHGKRTLGDVAGGRSIGHVVENVLYFYESEEDKKWNDNESNQPWRFGYKSHIRTMKKRNGEGGDITVRHKKSMCIVFEEPNQVKNRDL